MGSGIKQPLHFQFAVADALPEFLEEDAFVERVLVDQQHSLRRFQDEEGVLDLHAARDC